MKDLPVGRFASWQSVKMVSTDCITWSVKPAMTTAVVTNDVALMLTRLNGLLGPRGRAPAKTERVSMWCSLCDSPNYHSALDSSTSTSGRSSP